MDFFFLKIFYNIINTFEALNTCFSFNDISQHLKGKTRILNRK